VVLSSWRGGALVVRSSPTPQVRRRELGCCCRLPWRWTVVRFAGGAFLAPNDRRFGEAVGSFRVVERGGTAVP
jgi:hypothetical protein